MASLLTPRRNGPGLTLRATPLTEKTPEPAPADPVTPPVGWLVTALVGGLVTALASWILLAGTTVVGWLAADPGTLRGALTVGSRLWLLSNGVSAPFGTITVTLVPWGATALTAYLLARCAGYAARQVRPDQSVSALLVAVATVGAYLFPVLLVAIFLGAPWQAPLRWAAVVLALVGAALAASARVLGLDLVERWPAWARSVPRAVLGSQLVLLAAGAAVLATGLAVHLDRVTRLGADLHPGIGGGIALLLVQLAYAPNAVVWAASYAMGAGFSLGAGSLVAPAGTNLGLLPGIPLLGALPAAGPGSVAQLWWLAAGGLAGAVAAWLVVRARPRARFDETSLVGGLSGLLGGGCFVLLGWAASGDLGSLRLAGLGPSLLPLLVMTATTMGLSGMITGLLLGVLRRGRPVGGSLGADDPDAELTQPLPAVGPRTSERRSTPEGQQSAPAADEPGSPEAPTIVIR